MWRPAAGSGARTTIQARDPHHERDIPSDQLRDLTLGTARRDRVACQGRRVRSDLHRPAREARLVSRDLPPRQGAGALRRRAALVRVERDRGIPRRDGSPRGCIPKTRSSAPRNRAWTDFVPDFSASLGGVYYARDETALAEGMRMRAAGLPGSKRRSPGSGTTTGRTSTAPGSAWSTPPTRRSSGATPSSRPGSAAGCWTNSHWCRRGRMRWPRTSGSSARSRTPSSTNSSLPLHRRGAMAAPRFGPVSGRGRLNRPSARAATAPRPARAETMDPNTGSPSRRRRATLLAGPCLRGTGLLLRDPSGRARDCRSAIRHRTLCPFESLPPVTLPEPRIAGKAIDRRSPAPIRCRSHAAGA